MIYPDGWDAKEVSGCAGRRQTSTRWEPVPSAGPTSWPSLGSWMPSFLSFLAFVLGNRQDSLLAEELKLENKGKVVSVHVYGDSQSRRPRGVPKRLSRGLSLKTVRFSSKGLSSSG
ncbi:LHFPL4: Lipoma HMGIC fusion partner-like 4 protein [Crotalus adamanteus]|uniref:LHFPL4: Lipoma HMGIC fusion partner-like 4 protein n=1 Tax=Crotalus adamanteus TaxID=8729 RepID=A0AAW1BCW8_CROAD